MSNLKAYQEKTNIAANIINKQKRKSWETYISSLTPETPMKEIQGKIKSIKSSYVSSVFPLTENGVSITDSKMKADIFANHFKNIGNIGNVHKPLLPKLVLESYCAEGQQLEINKKITFSELNTYINSLNMTSP